MIITFPFEDDPYYSAPQPVSYTQSNAAALTTPALAKKYFDLARGVAGGVFPVGTNRFWHGGVHLKGTKPIRAIADGTIVAYRLDTDYTSSALDAQVRQDTPSSATSAPSRVFSSSFVLIRHECEKHNGISGRYAGAHFYSLYANLMPAQHLHEKPLLPPFLTTGEALLPVSALRGDEVEILAVNGDGHRMTKVRVTDVNKEVKVEGWIEHLYLDLDEEQGPPVPLAAGQKHRLGYPVCALYANHPAERKWRTRDKVMTLSYPVRVGEVIGYGGQTDSLDGALSDSFHFEIFSAKNVLVKPMKPLVPLNILKPETSHQDYENGEKSDGMGKVWLTRNADLATDKLSVRSALSAKDIVRFSAGSCFVSAAPCLKDGTANGNPSDLICFKLFDLHGTRYYAYANQNDAAADGRDFVKEAWVTLTTDSDWVTRGWQAYEDNELNNSDDAFVEDDDAVMRQIINIAHKSSAALNLDDLHGEGVDALLGKTAVRFHTEWDSHAASKRYQKLKTGEHPPLPKLIDAQFRAFIQDMGKQQFWADARVQTDGVEGPTLAPLDSKMTTENWHFHPVGFLAQMRECLTTDAVLSEEEFETEIRRNWIIGMKLVEKRLKQLEPWKEPNMPMPSPPASVPNIVREYATTRSIQNRGHATLWENFIYWFGVDPNTIIAPSTSRQSRTSAPAGHHVYLYMKGMKDVFRHMSMQQIQKGSLGFEAGAYVWQGACPEKPLVPAASGFKMECVNIACQYGLGFKSFVRSDAVDQNRMQTQLHEISHMVGTTCADDKVILLPDGTVDSWQFNTTTAYGALGARVLAEFHPEQAMANAENVAFFIESAKDEPVFNS
ncbi:hypothetical protein [Caballeronia novacaledonica]|uniref:Uncharacterized protein n=1 Tax=Caballeronia novacaledonica TaxID=1544861 RepID=A0AA37MTR5_9BURK|nr:hypothetical protein [Caballeronia novacaledonica]GJH28272.1 hypothetical protein CBA19CS42_27170 [Caballeronia novacaledonica]